VIELMCLPLSHISSLMRFCGALIIVSHFSAKRTGAMPLFPQIIYMPISLTSPYRVGGSLLLHEQ